jgi:hypothetical protein
MGMRLAAKLIPAFGSIQNKQSYHYITSYVPYMRRYDIRLWPQVPRKIKLAVLLVRDQIRHEAAFSAFRNRRLTG